MRLVTFVQGGAPCLGAVRTTNGRQTIVDLNRTEPRLPTDMIGFLTGGAEALALARETIAWAPSADNVALTSVTLKAPVMRPSKIIRSGLNYRDHAAEAHGATGTIATASADAPAGAVAGRGCRAPNVTGCYHVRALSECMDEVTRTLRRAARQQTTRAGLS